MKVNVTHIDSIKTFFNVAHYVNDEDGNLHATKACPNTFVLESSGIVSSSFKRKKNRKIIEKAKNTREGPSKKNEKLNSKK